MRPLLLFFTSLFLILAPVCDVRADGDDPITIPIEEGGSNESGPTYRGPLPIACVLHLSTSSIEGYFLLDLGAVSVEIENQTTGEYSQTIVNTQADPMIFPISGTVGFWTITFTLSCGTEYFGVFII